MVVSMIVWVPYSGGVQQILVTFSGFVAAVLHVLLPLFVPSLGQAQFCFHCEKCPPLQHVGAVGYAGQLIVRGTHAVV